MIIVNFELLNGVLNFSSQGVSMTHVGYTHCSEGGHVCTHALEPRQAASSLSP